MIVSHYDRPPCGRVENQLWPPHSPKHLSQSKRDDVGPRMEVLGLITHAILNYRMLDVGTRPTQIFPYCHT
jgi:hypothetical protein